MRIQILAPLASGLIFISCAPEEPAPPPGPVVTEIVPVNPTGTISGLVRDALANGPLAGVSVIVLQTGAEVVTDANGRFLAEDVPSSTDVALAISAAGYFDAFDRVSIPSSAGNLAQENGLGFSGPIALLPETATPAPVPVRVLDDEGNALAGAAVRANLGVRFFDDGVARDEISATGVEGAELGEYFLEGLPDLLALAPIAPNVLLTISVNPPVGANLAPAVRTISLSAFLATTPMEVSLTARVEAPLQLVATNVPEFFDDNPQQVPAVVPVGTAVSLTFSRDIDPAGVIASATDEAGQALVVSIGQPQPEVIELVVNAPLGAEILLDVHAEALVDDDAFDAAAFFFTPPAGGSPALVPGPYILTGQPQCPASPQPDVFIRLDGPIGARDLGGAPVPVGNLERARVEITAGLVAAADAGRFAPNSGDPVFAVVDEFVDGRESGFTTRLRMPWPGIPNEVINQGLGPADVSYTVNLVFNEGNATQVIDASGATLGTITGTMTLTVVCP